MRHRDPHRDWFQARVVVEDGVRVVQNSGGQHGSRTADSGGTRTDSATEEMTCLASSSSGRLSDEGWQILSAGPI